LPWALLGAWPLAQGLPGVGWGLETASHTPWTQGTCPAWWLLLHLLLLLLLRLPLLPLLLQLPQCLVVNREAVPRLALGDQCTPTPRIFTTMTGMQARGRAVLVDGRSQRAGCPLPGLRLPVAATVAVMAVTTVWAQVAGPWGLVPVRLPLVRLPLVCLPLSGDLHLAVGILHLPWPLRGQPSCTGPVSGTSGSLQPVSLLFKGPVLASPMAGKVP
jgi:hypothetical protein